MSVVQRLVQYVRRPAAFGRIAALLLLGLLVSAALGDARTALAHASLEQASPEAGARLETSPKQIALRFNERLEDELYAIRIYDKAGDVVRDKPVEMGEDRRTIALRLNEPLPEGGYTVSYRVISADGHPVSGSYVFTVGASAERPDVGAIVEENLHHGHSLEGDQTPADFLKHISRFLYYVSLLLLAGWLMWGWHWRRSSESARLAFAEGLKQWQRLLLASLLLYVTAHAGDLLGDAPADEALRLFTGTAIGRSWLFSLALSFAGFLVLGRSRWADAAWAGMLLGTKSVGGHANVFEPRWLTLLSDYAHLACASLWVSGLLYLVVRWRRNRDEAKRFWPVFSRTAFFSIVLLAVTGSSMALLYTNDLTLLPITPWGILLLVKLGLVLCVAAIAWMARRTLRRGPDRGAAFWVRLDAGFMALIVGVTALMTYVSPVPANEPVNWHEMGETVHMTAKIEPAVPGRDNTFTLDVWLPKGSGSPKLAEMYLVSKDREELAPIPVPLEPAVSAGEDEHFVSPDFDRTTYRATGMYLPFAGLWELEVRVRDHNDDERVYRKEFRSY
ncbi:copper resistance CopC/CopD family protein [Paenibacillus thermoaerophilus]|uniref:Copper resistance CopC/CopD family protein n=1 Tax=Paenibacillus thermoaerophilus TaxID=1215385 RepID=A0ABW2V133_9BACL|nr:copper resistance protein CopC [Paenibacillus thermoaerophilus]